MKFNQNMATVIETQTRKQNNPGKSLNHFTLEQMQRLLKMLESNDSTSQPHNINQVQRNT